MTDATNTKLMATEAGGEQTQLVLPYISGSGHAHQDLNRYEGASTFAQPHAKQDGQLGALSNSTTVTTDATTVREKGDRGEGRVENTMYGQAASESGFGSKEINSSGAAQQSGDTKTERQEVDETTRQSRREQGYNDGSGVGS
ncbi:MAG: hypothetical protein M1818_005077 [Claussenomyces sp. TS43310]|nr:MAG: hypothetical protein M1818_005077 [Claussenomyces sp. TS43310]